jgi:hypothetical protein
MDYQYIKKIIEEGNLPKIKKKLVIEFFTFSRAYRKRRVGTMVIRTNANEGDIW